MTRRMSTTSYAVLGLLAVRPLTPYEITQQMQRSLDYCWPTSERSLYDQPERLVAAGLARVERDQDPASRRRYAITPAGRRALGEWLATDSAMPKFQNEPLLRVLLADQAATEDLRRVLDALRAHTAERRRTGLATLEPYLEGQGLFQERVHIVALAGDLISRILGALDDWAADALELIAEWSSTADVGMTDDIRALVERIIATDSARDAETRTTRDGGAQRSGLESTSAGRGG